MLRSAVGLISAGVSGCGFRPLYGPNGAAAVAAGEPEIAAELGAVRVALIAERFGQLMRRGLTQRLGQTVGGPVQSRYDLRVTPVVQLEAVGVQRDGLATRVRYIATASWLLVRTGPPAETIASGLERTIEAYNVPINQFFAADSSRDAAEGRLAEVLSEQVVTRVAVEFRRRAAGLAAGAAPVPAAVPLPSDMGSMPGGMEPFGSGVIQRSGSSLR